MVNGLVKLRNKINKIDSKLVNLLKKRFEIAKKVGKYKLKKGLAVEDKKREQEIINAKCKKTSLSKSFTKKLLSLIFVESKRIQRDLK